MNIPTFHILRVGLAITVVGFFIIGGWFISQDKTKSQVLNEVEQLTLPIIKINEIEITVEIADTPEKKTQGLSKREMLAENHGMLFINDTPGIYSFWMKDMLFSIDIIWIDENFRVAALTKNILPDSFPQTFQPPIPIQYILEVNAGFSENNTIHIGDIADLLEIFPNKQTHN